MGRTGIIVTGIIAIALVVGGFIAFGNKKDNNKATNNSSTAATSAQSNSSNTGTTAAIPASATTITYNGSSFSPSQVTVKKGDTVVVKNDSSAAVDFESNPHPIHTDEPELNIGIVDPGLSKSFKATKAGSWGYHNHLNPGQTGTVIVN